MKENSELERKIYNSLMNRCERAFTNINLPKESTVFSKILFPSLNSINYMNNIISDIDQKDHDTAYHSMRVGLYCIATAKFFGIFEKNIQWGRYFAEAGILHDYGKLTVEELHVYQEGKDLITGGRPWEDRTSIVGKKSKFTDKDKQKMADHVDLLMFLEEPAKSIIAYHHSHRKNNPIIPKNAPYLKRTPETDIISAVIEVIDCYDAAATRINTRNSPEPRSLCPEEVLNILIEEYRDLPIVYKGNKLPKFDLSGKELIDTLYNENIFGRRDIMNPFSHLSKVNIYTNNDLTIFQGVQFAVNKFKEFYQDIKCRIKRKINNK